VVDLVARGQITRDHDMSSDAVNWAKASEFTTFFPPSPAQAVKAPPSKTEPDAPATETWFLNVDGDTVKSFDEPTIKKMIADGKIQSSNQLWNQDTSLWQDVGEFRPQWFAGAGRSTGTAASGTGERGGDEVCWRSLGQQLVSARSWLSFLSILGLIVGTIAFFTTTGLFFSAIVSNYSIALKLCLVIALIGQVLSALAWLYFFTRLLSYTGLLVAIKFRNEPAEIIASIAGQSVLWRTVTIVFLVWIISTVIGLLLVVIAWQLEPDNSDYEYGVVPVSIASNPAAV